MLIGARTLRTLTAAAAVWVFAWAAPAGAQTATDLDCSGCVDSGDLANGSIGNRKLQDDSVGDRKIKDGAIGQKKIKDDAIGQRKIKDRAIGARKLKLGAVATENIQDGAVSAAKLAPDAVFGRILVVRNDPADPLGNCDELLAVLADITDNDVDNRYTVVLEPGTYDCGATSIQMKPFVDLAGSGQDTTEVIGNPVNKTTSFLGVVMAASNAELTSLTVRNIGTARRVSAIHSENTNARLSNLAAEALDSGENQSIAISIRGGTPTLLNVTARAHSPQGLADARAIYTTNANATLINVKASATRVGNRTAEGLAVASGVATARDSVLTGDDYALYVLGRRPKGEAYIIGSQLDGPVFDDGIALCLGSYDGNFAPLNRGCQAIP
ncbi:MAG: hypothetical protein QNJ67_18540 [Kiloniellales bacterium]|nr:hypothetical protein [Kiloniellales bacterium]